MVHAFVLIDAVPARVADLAVELADVPTPGLVGRVGAQDPWTMRRIS
jgi:hypothetical protein